MNIFEIIPRDFYQMPASDSFISCRLPSGIQIVLIDNCSSITTGKLVYILNGRLMTTGITYENVTCERRDDDFIIFGTRHGSTISRSLCVVKKITAEQLGLQDLNENDFQSEIVYIMMTIFSSGAMPSEYRVQEEETEDLRQYIEKSDKLTVLDEDALINTSDFIDKISKCCNDNTTKVIVRYKDNELKIIDTYLEKDFLYIDVINPKKMKA